MKITVKNITESALQVSDNLVEGSLATGAKWQKISAKLMKEGTVLFGKQQDLTLSTLEEVKGLVLTGNKRFRNLLGINFNLPKAKKAANAPKVEKVEKTIKLVAVKKTTKPVAVKKARTTTKVVKKTAAKTPVKK